MSNSSEEKDQYLGSDVQGAQPAAEAPQEADILTDSLGQEESLKEREAQSLDCVRKKENTSSTAFVDSEVLRSQQDQATDYSSHAGTREGTAPTEASYSSSDSLSETPKDDSESDSYSSSVQANTQLSLNDSDHEALDTEAQLEAVGVMAQQDDGVGVNAKMYKRKLRKGLKKLSGLSWPSRDRLAVFSDVFDDVCEGSPVFGRILREIKTEYDLYISHLMDTHSSQDNVPLEPFVNDIDDIIVSDNELEGAEKGVCSLEEEAKSALGENKRAQDELKNFLDECSSTRRSTEQNHFGVGQREAKRGHQTDAVERNRKGSPNKRRIASVISILQSHSICRIQNICNRTKLNLSFVFHFTSTHFLVLVHHGKLE
ncbi:uncharacterized protein C6orf118 homolog isoform X4 [Xiphophorus maculatus]|uniref:uncharacterized protein C6orf118 homolog isoform X4 n=1 Tax=Xiphophorus maculatus TaxID=8083 RepID=UPI000C6DD208|nr:uncharacterized protein C6orf118 homolog isoform X4 [Xiphophorus maculatus]